MNNLSQTKRETKRKLSAIAPVEPRRLLERINRDRVGSYKDLLRTLAPKFDGAKDVDRLVSVIEGSFAVLETAAIAGRFDAHSAIVRLASRFCASTSLLSSYDRKSSRRIARKQVSWPIGVHYHPEQRRMALKEVDDLPLAEGLLIAIPKKKPFSLETPINGVVYREFQMQLAANSTLPPLGSSPTAAEIWFEAIWSGICSRRPPEADPQLRQYGIPMAKSKEAAYPKGSKTYESLVRAGIRQKARVAFLKIVRCPE